ncbi:MAG: Trm112 family protein [Desulfuromonadaceae bacterium]|nr:Trm112 family protein [Desulfuromonadaceae bacterium]
MMFTSELLDILACPACKGTLTPLGEPSSLLCQHCGLKFPVREGIPIMLINEAERTH